MKTTLMVLLLTSVSLSFAGQINFSKIFREIKKAKTSTEAIKIRERYLSKMVTLNDFDRLTDLEHLSSGEFYFDHYKKSLSRFVLNNVDRFMFDRSSDYEREIYARNIISKAYGRSMQDEALEKGLFYVKTCDEFKAYVRMAKAPTRFSASLTHEYCFNDDYTGIGRTFELIANTQLIAGEYKTLYLPGNIFVSKLYISVEGIYSDAYFDVMVNGDIKGTIYAPGKDPLYIINVSENASSINLRSMFGSASIKSIKVETR